MVNFTLPTRRVVVVEGPNAVVGCVEVHLENYNMLLSLRHTYIQIIWVKNHGIQNQILVCYICCGHGAWCMASIL